MYFIRHKSDVVARFKEYEKLVANKFGRPMKVLRSDNGKEYINQEMSNISRLEESSMRPRHRIHPNKTGSESKTTGLLLKALVQ